VRTVLIDKIGSVTTNCRLSREVRVSDDIPAIEGGVIAVRVLNSKSTYNTIELPSGRFSSVKPGDVLAVALGHRKALFGYSGYLPKEVKTGDKLNILNLGGVTGICDSINPDLGEPFIVEVLGQVLTFPYLGERIGIPAHITQNAIPVSSRREMNGVPVVAIVGTTMSAGKTAAACGLVQAFSRNGLKVMAAKCTGVSLRRDILAMEDAGAKRIGIFTDHGIVTTTPEVAPNVTRTLLTQLAADRPDVIILELGDGLLGLYGVDAILNDVDIRATFGAVVLAASDPVAAWGGVQLLRDRHSLGTTVVTGPATDNAAGIRLVEAQAKAPGINARTHAKELAALIMERMGLKKGAGTQ
jgi:hypothetical protein